MKPIKWDLLISAFLVVFLTVFLVELRDVTPIARIYPICAIVGSFLMIAIVVIQAIYRSRHNIVVTQTEDAAPLDKRTAIRIFFYALAILAYVLLMEVAGYFISSILFMVFSLIYQKNKSKMTIIGFSLAFTVVLYLVFAQFLYVTLPTGSWIEKFF